MDEMTMEEARERTEEIIELIEELSDDIYEDDIYALPDEKHVLNRAADDLEEYVVGYIDARQSGTIREQEEVPDYYFNYRE